MTLQKDKGRKGEGEVIELLERAGFRRPIRMAPMQHGHAKTFPDVDTTEGLPLWLEVRRRANLHGLGSMIMEELIAKPAMRAAATLDTRPPVLVYREDRGEWFATMRAADLFKLARAAALLLPDATDPAAAPATLDPPATCSSNGPRGVPEESAEKPANPTTHR